MGEVVEDSSGPVLIGTKLRSPPVRDQVVPRERLFERLRAGAGRALSLLACPPGYGKTTLLAAWREAEAARKPVAWLTLDDGDNDPVVLWSYVIEALRRACPAISVAASPQIAGAAAIVHSVLPCLVNELDDLGEVTLILDDFDRLSDGPARESLAWFVDHAPPGFQLVLSARTEPDLPLPALRAHGELLELRAADLRFTPGEADAFLNGRLGLGLRGEHAHDDQQAQYDRQDDAPAQVESLPVDLEYLRHLTHDSPLSTLAWTGEAPHGGTGRRHGPVTRSLIAGWGTRHHLPAVFT
jgi:LuxR family transcriptional regulator, maltose regulon positive regulatory protein